MKTINPKPQLAGLYLWEIQIAHLRSCISQSSSLWILTDNGSARRAASKAEKFLRSRDGMENYPQASIKNIFAAGTIDA